MLRPLYKMRLLPGVLLSLPMLMIVGWYAWSAYAAIDRYLRASDDAIPLDSELFQIALFDELDRDARRMSVPPRPADSRLPVYSISLTRDALDALSSQLDGDGSREYVKGHIEKDGEVHEVGIRYRGSQPWYWLGPQKSIKIRVRNGELLDGTGVFNLLNDPTPFGLEDQIILDLAREEGLLTPAYHPAWVRINNSGMGVYRYAAQPVEDLLRRGRRVPGSIYSGDTETIDPEAKVGALFFAREGWKKVASRTPESAEDFSDLDVLLQALNGDSFAEFADYARHSIDLDRFARMDALDVVFGGNDHDYYSNHKLYFDPYRGRVEPIAWSFRGFQHEPVFNLVDHPLLVRLKQVPGYLSLRNRYVYELITSTASGSEIRRIADRLFAEMLPELAADPYWDAYKLLPRVTRFHRFMLRPMSEDKWLLAAQAEIAGFNTRSRFLLNSLERPDVTAGWSSGNDGPTRVQLAVDGNDSYRLREIFVAAPCSGRFSMRADVDRNGLPDATDPEVATGKLNESGALTGFAELLPGTILDPHPDPDSKHGRVRVNPDARDYLYFLATNACAPTALSVVLENEVTGGSSRIPLARGELPRVTELPHAGEIPKLVVGQRSPHLWDFPATPRAREVRLGPGAIRFDTTHAFVPQESVAIAPGTRIELGPDATLVFLGPLRAEGTVTHPIVIARADPARAFGGIALQGWGTRGSLLSHVRIDGGSRARFGTVEYTGVLNIHDTSGITLDDVAVSGATGSDDVVHAVYVNDLKLNEMTVLDAPTDAVDLEFCSGEVRGLRVWHAGDDCLDLMGDSLRVTDSSLVGCVHNAVSAGEETELWANGLLIADSRTGLLAKNASHARLARSLVYRTETALHTKAREAHYTGESTIDAEDLSVIDCQRIDDAARGCAIDPGLVQTVLPIDGVLAHLRRSLGLSSWDRLDQFLAEKKGRPTS